MTFRRKEHVAIAAILLAAVALVAIELARGALDYGEGASRDPCTATTTFSGDGLDATVQRIVLRGLDGAACELETTREELVLSLDPDLAQSEREWDRDTIERAVRAGLLRAVSESRDEGEIGGLTAVILTEVIERAPLDILIRGVEGIAGLF
jgi:hypothetical protein